MRNIDMNPPPTLTREQFEIHIRSNCSEETADYIMGLFVSEE